MRGIIIFAHGGPVVFHTPLCTRSLVDNVVTLVASDLALVGSYNEGAAAARVARSGRERKSARGGPPLPSEGMVVAFVGDHPWLAPPPLAEYKAGSNAEVVVDESEFVSILWRRVQDRVLVLVLESEENMALAANAMSTLIVLLSEAFKCSGELPSLQTMSTYPEVVNAVCNVVAPGNLLATVDLHIARNAMNKLR